MQEKAGAGGYWYTQDTEQQAGAVGVLNALREYRASEAAMRRRTRSSMGMGETDLLALRYLLQAEAQGRAVGPKELGSQLGVTSASMTTLIDRLVKTGHIRREPHPTDRRALILRPTPGSDEEVRRTLGLMHQRMIAVASSLSAKEAEIIARFLTSMRDAVDAIDSENDEGR
ncbi:MarR family winged helix-turn-helix transcriptional regulator [Arthrobacter mangrovi]|uniref:MarR family transcriptional regulator n=1 Tax=Arthrobacter mangrovi TaxID=2966350 RepID=A0ABQ5MVJ2_9MICC|nr:MarR family transcriptional regulator [Arthrobacter mangrovi]GLB67996.1 MarR family transcriptional regulator [Arthrobacter mangrovi]